MNVFLDDIRTPDMSHQPGKGLGKGYSDNWVVIRDYFEFVKFLDENINEIDLISFDHDIASYKDGVEFTGKDAADYLIDKCMDNGIKLPSWYVHSDNTSGKENIKGVMINYLRVVEKVDVSKFRYFHNGILNGLAV